MFAMLGVMIFFVKTSQAGSWEQASSARFTNEYDSNPARSAYNPGGVWRTMLEPGYTLTGRFSMDLWRTGLSVQMERSSDETLSPTRNSPIAFMDWLHQYSTGEFGISTHYTEISTRYSTIDNTAQAPASSTRTSRGVSGTWQQALSNRSMLSFNANHENVFYSGGNFIDYASRSAEASFKFALDESHTPYMTVQYVDYEPSSGIEPGMLVRSLLGWNWKNSDHLEFTIQGGRYHNSQAQSGSLYSGTAQYTGENHTFLLNAQRQVAPSGLGGFVTVDQANASWGHDLNERNKTGIDLTIQKNLDSNAINRTEGIWLQNILSLYWNMRLYYSHNQFYGDAIAGSSSNIIGLTFTYTYPDF